MQFADDMAASRIILSDGTVLLKCDQCRQIYAERRPPGAPPCESCRVDLLEENQDASVIFSLVRNQMILGPNGPIDLNHLAIHADMELYQIKNRRQCFEKVIRLWWDLRRVENK